MSCVREKYFSIKTDQIMFRLKILLFSVYKWLAPSLKWFHMKGDSDENSSQNACTSSWHNVIPVFCIHYFWRVFFFKIPHSLQIKRNCVVRQKKTIGFQVCNISLSLFFFFFPAAFLSPTTIWISLVISAFYLLSPFFPFDGTFNVHLRSTQALNTFTGPMAQWL